MELITAAKASDGTLFETADECERYEYSLKRQKLVDSVTNHCVFPKSQGHIHSQDVAAYIIRRWSDIQEIMNCKSVDNIETDWN